MNKQITIQDKEPGQVVAVQFPDNFEMSISVGDGAKALKKYGHLKQLDPDDKDGRKELAEGIKDLKKRISDNKKEEATTKGPVNKWRDVILKTAKKLRGEIDPVLTLLKDESQRIDDIIEERMEAQRRVHNTNLQTINSLGNASIGLPADKLADHLAAIDAINLDDLDYGELLEDAKAALANARAIAEQAIAQEKQRLELEERRLELERKQEEADEKEKQRVKVQAEKDRQMHWEMAIAQNKTIDLEAQLAAAQKPEPELVTVEIADCFPEDESAEGFEPGAVSPEVKEIGQLIVDSASSGLSNMQQNRKPCPWSDGDNSGAHPQSTTRQLSPAFGDEQEEVVASEADKVKINALIGRIDHVIGLIPEGFESVKCSDLVIAVKGNLNKMVGHLTKVKGE